MNQCTSCKSVSSEEGRSMAKDAHMPQGQNEGWLDLPAQNFFPVSANGMAKEGSVL